MSGKIDQAVRHNCEPKAAARQIERLNRLKFLAIEVVRGHNGFCPQCGLVSTDEDDCCILCGATSQGDAMRELMDDLARL